MKEVITGDSSVYGCSHKTFPVIFYIAEQFYFAILVSLFGYRKQEAEMMQWEDRIGRRIKFRDPHIALTVAQSGSMLKAAEALAISQPVVSKVMKLTV